MLHIVLQFVFREILFDERFKMSVFLKISV